MSEIRHVEFLCPLCRFRNQAEFHTFVNAAKEPELEARLLAGSLSETTCAGCRERVQMEHSILLADRNGQDAVWLDPPNDPIGVGDLPNSTARGRLRRVTDSNALREVAAIWRDGLDDAAMLLLKHMLAARMLEETGTAPILCAYEDRFNMEGEEWLEYVVFTSEEGDPETLRTPFSTYLSVADATRPHVGAVFPYGQWVDWDEKAARTLWEAMQKA